MWRAIIWRMPTTLEFFRHRLANLPGPASSPSRSALSALSATSLPAETSRSAPAAGKDSTRERSNPAVRSDFRATRCPQPGKDNPDKPLRPPTQDHETSRLGRKLLCAQQRASLIQERHQMIELAESVGDPLGEPFAVKLEVQGN